MSLNANKVVSSEFKQQEALEVGTYAARVVQVLDLGVQAQRPYKGEEKPPVHEVMLTYELTEEFMKDDDGEDIEDKPRFISETFPFRSLQSDLAKSTKRYRALDPEEKFGGDFTLLIGSPCNVTVTQNEGKNGRIYNNISGISPMQSSKAKGLPELINEPKVFLMDSPDPEVFESLPEWIQEKMKSNINFEGSPLQATLSGKPITPKDEEKEDDVPDFDDEDDADASPY